MLIVYHSSKMAVIEANASIHFSAFAQGQGDYSFRWKDGITGMFSKGGRIGKKNPLPGAVCCGL